MLNKLINILIDEKVISKDNCENAILDKYNLGKSLEEMFTYNGLISEPQLCEILERRFNIENINLDSVIIDDDILRILPKETVKKHCLMPFKLERNLLYVAMSNPLNTDVIEEIKFITNKEILPYYDKKDNILCAIENYYYKRMANEALENLKIDNKQTKPDKESNSDIFIDDTPIIKLTDSIVNQAINDNASDIHLDPFEDGAVVRFRIDGVLKEEMVIPNKIYPSVCARIKIKSGMDISKKLIPQDGKMEYQAKNDDLDFRVASIPTLFGEKIVIRILYKLNRERNLDNLIINKDQRRQVKSILRYRNGIILVAGPTGSGKTTTLCAMINELNSVDRNIISIEDPVEYVIKGINQVNVNNKAGLTFANGLRNILRQDPDIIMVGEIRDEETAQIAVKAAITGHLVISTIHTNNAFGAILRLIDMNVPNYLVADSLIAVIAQRLVRKICPLCKKEYYPSEDEINILHLNSSDRLYRGEGCKNCNKTGYKGRVAVLEILGIDNVHREIMKNKNSSANLKSYSIEKGMVTLSNSCRELVIDGVTSGEEMMRVYYEGL